MTEKKGEEEREREDRRERMLYLYKEVAASFCLLWFLLRQSRDLMIHAIPIPQRRNIEMLKPVAVSQCHIAVLVSFLICLFPLCGLVSHRKPH